jgi:hypothetical protein
MPKTMAMEELHLTLVAPADLLKAEYAAMVRSGSQAVSGPPPPGRARSPTARFALAEGPRPHVPLKTLPYRLQPHFALNASHS